MTTQTKLFAFHKKTFFLFGIIFSLLFSISCRKKNPEEKQYDALQSDLKYKSYKTLSENTIPPLVLLYNTTNHPEYPEISEGVLRLLLGYNWAVSNKVDFAIAESNIILDNSKNKDIKLLAHSLAAICMYEKGWRSIAKEEIENVNELISKKDDPKEDSKLLEMTDHLMLGTLSVYQENVQNARYHFISFSIVSGIHWPYEIADAMTDFKEGRKKSGLKKIKAISKSLKTPQNVKDSLKETILNIDITKDAVDSKLLWSNNTSQAIYSELKHSNIPGINKVTVLLNQLSKQMKIN